MGSTKNQLVDEGRRAFLRHSLFGGVATGVLVGCGQSEIPVLDEVDDAAQPQEPADSGDDAVSGGESEQVDGGGEDVVAEEPPAPNFELPDYATLPIDDGFVFGVSSGDVRYDAAILWCYLDADVEMAVALWQVDSEDRWTRVSEALELRPNDRGYCHHEIEIPTPGAWYRYVFYVRSDDGAWVSRSPVGRFRAALAPDALETLKFGAVACCFQGLPPRPLEHAAFNRELDGFLFLGDSIYNDGSETQAEFHESWAQNLTKSSIQTLRGSTSVLATWDDHEITDNFDPESVSVELFEIARQSFFDVMPLRREVDDTPERLWRSVKWGATVEIFLLDSRSERTPSKRQSEDGEYLSRAQMTWLKEGLSSSNAKFKLIMNSVPISDFPGFFDAAPEDRWEGYPAQREEILAYIDDEEIPGVLWVAGDFHLASVQRVSVSGAGQKQNEILVGPGAQVGNPLAIGLSLRDQFDWSSTRNNYTTISLDPISETITLEYIGADVAGNAETIYSQVLDYSS